MTCILADLSHHDIKWLDARATEQGTSRASMLREVIARDRRRLERAA